MTKTETIKRISEITGLGQGNVKAVIDALTGKQGVICATLKKGGRVIISGFGTFLVRERNARKARNPKTGGKVKVPKRRYPAFKPAKSLKDALKK